MTLYISGDIFNFNTTLPKGRNNMDENFEIYILSSYPSIISYLSTFADTFGHKITGSSSYLYECVGDCKKAAPDVIICSTGLTDSTTEAALERLRKIPELSKCVFLTAMLRHERCPNIINTFVVPFETYAFNDMLINLVHKKRSDRKPACFTPVQRKKNERITKILHTLGMSSDLEGYALIHRIVSESMDDYRVFKNFTSLVYRRLGNEQKKSAKYIERAISSAITASWLKCPIDVAQSIFGNSIGDCPSNKVYIATVVEYLNGEYDLAPEDYI